MACSSEMVSLGMSVIFSPARLTRTSRRSGYHIGLFGDERFHASVVALLLVAVVVLCVAGCVWAMGFCFGGCEGCFGCFEEKYATPPSSGKEDMEEVMRRGSGEE